MHHVQLSRKCEIAYGFVDELYYDPFPFSAVKSSVNGSSVQNYRAPIPCKCLENAVLLARFRTVPFLETPLEVSRFPFICGLS